ncbi:5-hydroxyisourate hydrolase [Sphaerisporangium krabiense]|uniref:5-hydroxyisourate hydrolase n=1 Tax=Sphaerisporangium krabiense TaxID=763782 RepID=A0A7W8Z852_9ACTN|nr:hydroxyisourate hydrolase [Sphaerisporangium krabiense]MBB5629208.1 5-hydroxyisourate hydrolase [Sphaerisporangium krabiense]GII59949.1 5-hydroxyisourate hydrolase [Sphaerisporangium krabiense]
MSLSTHVLDAGTGRPASGVVVGLHRGERLIAEGVTGEDGRLNDWLPGGEPGAGVHRLVFHTGAYFAARGVRTFYPEVVVTFTVEDPGEHHHVPLLLSPFAYSTYRGS